MMVPARNALELTVGQTNYSLDDLRDEPISRGNGIVCIMNDPVSVYPVSRSPHFNFNGLVSTCQPLIPRKFTHNLWGPNNHIAVVLVFCVFPCVGNVSSNFSQSFFVNCCVILSLA